MVEAPDVLHANGPDSVHRGLHGLQTHPADLELPRQRFSESPLPYSSSPSGPTTGSASPDSVDAQQRQEEQEQERRRVVEQHEAYLPDRQLAAEIADEERHMFEAPLNGRSSVDPRVSMYGQARKVVVDRWIDQGIWKEEWNDQFHLPGRWKHEEPIHTEGEASGVYNNGVPRAVSIEQQKALDHQRQASRPYYRFIYQLSTEREYILANPDTEEGFVTHDINTKAYENVRQNWAQRGLWDDRWGIIPGMTWKHEEPLPDENNRRLTVSQATVGLVEAPNSAPSFTGFGTQVPAMELRPGSEGTEADSRQPSQSSFTRPKVHGQTNQASSTPPVQLLDGQSQTIDDEEPGNASFPTILVQAHRDTAHFSSESSRSQTQETGVAKASFLGDPIPEDTQSTSTRGSSPPLLPETSQIQTDMPQESLVMDKVANESPENPDFQHQGESSASVANSVRIQPVEKEASHEDREKAWRTYFEHLHGPYDLFLARSRLQDAAENGQHLVPSSVDREASSSASGPQPPGNRKRTTDSDEGRPSQSAKRARVNDDKSEAQEASLVDTPSIPTKRRGRPRKQIAAVGVTSAPSIDRRQADLESSSVVKPGRKGRKGAEDPRMNDTTSKLAMKGRPRGRPRKDAATTSNTTSTLVQPSKPTSTRRVIATRSTSPSPTIAKKSQTEMKEDVSVRKRGRPRKVT